MASDSAAFAQKIIRVADRLSRAGLKLRGFEEELELLASLLERIDALKPLPQYLAADINNCFDKAKCFIGILATIVPVNHFTLNPLCWIRQLRNSRILKICRLNINKATESLLDHAGYLEEMRLLERLGDNQSQVPRYLWRFIYYFLLFPANFQVPTRRLIVLWVVEGLIRPTITNLHESVEIIGERYLNVLINLGLVLVTKKKLNGKVQACLLKDDIRDSWLMEAKNANFFQSRRGHIRRLVDRAGTAADVFFVRIHGNPNIFRSVPDYGDVVSFSSFNTEEGSKPGEDIGNFFHKCILSGCFLGIKVLDLERVFRPKLTSTLGELVRLKYLGLRWTYLEHLPNSVNKLLQLQVLDVKHTYISVLPSSIWRMQDLRHLYLSEAYRTRFPDRPSGTLSLSVLQTLWGAFIDEHTSVTQGLDTLQGIRKLGLSCCPRSSVGDSDMSEQLKAVDKWISKLRYLESLRLKSRDKQGGAADLHLSTLEENRNLSTVYLLGRLNPDVVCKFPERLTDITLSGSELDMDPMEFLGRLPNLQILRLLANSVLHPKMHCSRGGFPLLKVVHIWCLENLEEWQVEEGSLTCLEEFEIRSCPRLEKLPHQLQYINTILQPNVKSLLILWLKHFYLVENIDF